jgi:hypothetical protein
VTGFDGREHKLNLAKFKKRSDRNKSAPHQAALSLLYEVFPGFPIYEEITLPGSKRFKSNCLYADIFIPGIPLIVEVHGRQHYEFVSFFHKTKADFYSALRADKDKAEWARINNISFAVLPYNEEDKWKQIIDSTISRD